jgi:hypothetical protein
VNASHSCPNAHLIRVHSWFKNTTPFVSIRGSKTPLHSYPFVVQKTPLHSCQSVVQKQPSIRVHSWFKKHHSIRVNPWFKNSPPFVSIRGSKHPSIRVNSWFKTPLHSCPFVVQKTPLHSCLFVVQNSPPFMSIRGSKQRSPGAVRDFHCISNTQNPPLDHGIAAARDGLGRLQSPTPPSGLIASTVSARPDQRSLLDVDRCTPITNLPDRLTTTAFPD